MVDTQAIRHRMRQKKLTVPQIASRLAMDQSTFHRKLSRNGATFTLEQAQILASVLEFTPEESQTIFFDAKLA